MSKNSTLVIYTNCAGERNYLSTYAIFLFLADRRLYHEFLPHLFLFLFQIVHMNISIWWSNHIQPFGTSHIKPWPCNFVDCKGTEICTQKTKSSEKSRTSCGNMHFSLTRTMPCYLNIFTYFSQFYNARLEIDIIKILDTN